MVRKKQRPEETEEQDGWRKANTLALIADAIARVVDVLFDKR